MAYIALKPCSFGGQSFRIGEAIPSELVSPEMVRRFVEMGRIASVSVSRETPAPDTDEVPETDTDEVPEAGSAKSKSRAKKSGDD